MKTLNVRYAALVHEARQIGSARTLGPASRIEPVAATGAAIERQLDEIQRTFGVRWEW